MFQKLLKEAGLVVTIIRKSSIIKVIIVKIKKQQIFRKAIQLF